MADALTEAGIWCARAAGDDVIVETDCRATAPGDAVQRQRAAAQGDEGAGSTGARPTQPAGVKGPCKGPTPYMRIPPSCDTIPSRHFESMVP